MNIQNKIAYAIFRNIRILHVNVYTLNDINHKLSEILHLTTKYIHHWIKTLKGRASTSLLFTLFIFCLEIQVTIIIYNNSNNNNNTGTLNDLFCYISVHMAAPGSLQNELIFWTDIIFQLSFQTNKISYVADFNQKWVLIWSNQPRNSNDRIYFLTKPWNLLFNILKYPIYSCCPS